jgi:DNA-binding CsgD family transcriptional regulator
MAASETQRQETREREAKIVKLLAEGLRPPAIAERLRITLTSVYSIMCRIRKREKGSNDDKT